MVFRRMFASSRFLPACRRTARNLSAYMDGELPGAEIRQTENHLRQCPHCARRHEELLEARSRLRRLAVQPVPAELSRALRVLAIRESARRRQQLQERSNWGRAASGLLVRMQNAMRPLAIPFSGGLVSALVLFSMLLPFYPVITPQTYVNDVPTILYTDPAVKSVAPFGFSSAEIVVDLVIDEQGQVVDYSFPQGFHDPRLRREIENTLLFAQFTPAMAFGQPTPARLRLSFRRSHIDVKG